MGVYKFESTFKIFSNSINNNPPPRMKSGFIILSNHTSIIDIFYFTYLMSPMFTKIFYKKKVDKDEVCICPLNFFEQLKMGFSLRYQLPNEGDEKELAQIPMKKLKIMNVISDSFDQWNGPLLFFFEGALTNGQGILQVNETLMEEIMNVQNQFRRDTVMFNIQYENTSFYTPINTTRNPWLHFFLLLTNFQNKIKITAKTAPYPVNPTNKVKEFAKSVQQFYQSTGIKSFQVSWKEYQQFLDYWQQTKSSVYIDDVKKQKKQE